MVTRYVTALNTSPAIDGILKLPTASQMVAQIAGDRAKQVGRSSVAAARSACGRNAPKILLLTHDMIRIIRSDIAASYQ